MTLTTSGRIGSAFTYGDLEGFPDDGNRYVDESLVGGQSVTGVPDLVVEIHLPATRVLNLTEKRLVYAKAGVPAYWMVDPDASTLTVLELNEDTYDEIAAVVDARGSADVVLPAAITIEGPAIFGT